MPSHAFHRFSDQDVGDLVAYIRSLPPVDYQPGKHEVRLVPRALAVLTSDLVLFPARIIDHDAPRRPAPKPDPTAEYGEYLAETCKGCHGPGLSGGPIPGAPPDFAPAANITAGGELIGWSEADFAKAIRTGVTPTGRQLDPLMPYNLYQHMTDEEISALWAYLQTVPAKPYGQR